MGSLTVVGLAAGDLEEIVPSWHGLWKRVKAPVFQHPAWALSVPVEDRLVGHAAFEHGRLVALILLSPGPDGMRFAGHPLNDANEILAVDGRAFEAVLRAALTAHPGSHRLEQLAPEGPTATLLRAVDDLEVAWIDPEPCPVLPVGSRPTPNLAKRLEHDRRFKEVKVSLRRPTPSDVTAFVLRRLRAWSDRGALGRLGEVERHPTFPGALGRACGSLAVEGLCRLALLEVNGRVVAEDLYLGNTVSPLLYMRTYDRGSALSSPGLHLADLVRQLPGIGDIDLGRGSEEYKMRLGARADVRLAADIGLCRQ